MKRIIRVLALLFITVALFTPGNGFVRAQSNALSITPRKDYTLKNGESVSDTLNITNRDPVNPLSLSLNVVDFTAENETGTPRLMEDNAQKTPWSIRDFVTLPEQVVIAPSETVRVPITVSVPSDTGAGSYYSAIEYASVNDVSQDKVNISASSVTLVFIRVPGQATQQLSFEQFGAFVPSKEGTDGSFAGLFFSGRPKVLAYRLKNEGNVAEQPNATIIVKNSSGDTVYTIDDANPKDQLALRGQTRRFDACIAPETVQQTTDTGTDFDAVICGDTNFTPGRYTAELSVIYGENGTETREITAKTTFWYLPWWFLGLIVLGIGVLVIIGFYVKARVSSYRSRKTRRR